MRASFSDTEARLELSLVLQYIGYGLFGLFVAFLLKLVLPVELLQPAWQLKFANALRTTALFPLLGAVLLLLAQLFRSQSTRMADQLQWMRRLAFLAAIGFLLLIPLQTHAGLKLLGDGNSVELRAMRQVKQVAEEIRLAKSEAALKRAISQLPGAPAQIQGAFTKPLNQVRAVVFDQLQPQIQRADYRLSELRKLRLQGDCWAGSPMAWRPLPWLYVSPPLVSSRVEAPACCSTSFICRTSCVFVKAWAYVPGSRWMRPGYHRSMTMRSTQARQPLL